MCKVVNLIVASKSQNNSPTIYELLYLKLHPGIEIESPCLNLSVPCAIFFRIIIVNQTFKRASVYCSMHLSSSHTKCNHSTHVSLMKQRQYILYCTYHSWCTLISSVDDKPTWLAQRDKPKQQNWRFSFFLCGSKTCCLKSCNSKRRSQSVKEDIARRDEIMSARWVSLHTSLSRWDYQCKYSLTVANDHKLSMQ